MKKNTIAIIIPTINEAKVIGKTIRQLLKCAKKQNIYLVDDGSQDRTVAIARKYLKNVLALRQNKGKADALNTAISHFRLAQRYLGIFPLDADTSIDQNFLRTVGKIFRQDHQKKIACVVGRVHGSPKNWLTTYRIWEYEIAQSIHKKAQGMLQSISVCSGCATVYRSQIFKKVGFPQGTVTEDMDLTFTIHRARLGKIIYSDEAHVLTQDPSTFFDFIKQIRRWYSGFWQCVNKHNLPWGGQMLDFEVAFLGIEGLYNGIFSLLALVFVTLSINQGNHIFMIPILIDFFVFMLPTLIWTAIRYKTYFIFAYVLHFYLLRLLTSIIFILAFFRFGLGDNQLAWNKVRRY